MWFTLVSILYVIVCAFLIAVVLLQQGKGGGMGSAFGGGGGSNTVFGGAGAGNFLTRLTAIAATLFMVLSAVLAYMSTSSRRAIEALEEVAAEQAEDTAEAAGGDDGTADDGTGEDDAADDTAEPPETTEDAIEREADEALDALEEELGADGEEPAAEEPAAEEPAAEEPEEPAPTPEAAAPAPAPAPAAAAPRPRPRPRPAAPAAEGEGEAAPAAPAPAAPAPAEPAAEE